MLDSPLMEQMRCTLLTNDHGDVIVLHDQPLKSEVQWVEFNEEELSFTIVYEDGNIQPLGIQIALKFGKHISKSTKVQFALVKDKKTVAVQKVSIVIQDY